MIKLVLISLVRLLASCSSIPSQVVSLFRSLLKYPVLVKERVGAIFQTVAKSVTFHGFREAVSQLCLGINPADFHVFAEALPYQ